MQDIAHRHWVVVVPNALVVDLQDDIVYVHFVAQRAMLADANHLVAFNGAVGHVLLADNILRSYLNHANAKRAMDPLRVADTMILDPVDARIAFLRPNAAPEEGDNLGRKHEEVVADWVEKSLEIATDINYGSARNSGNLSGNGRSQLTDSGEGAEGHAIRSRIDALDGEGKIVDKPLVVAEHNKKVRTALDLVGISKRQGIHAVKGLHATMTTVGPTRTVASGYLQRWQARIAGMMGVNVEEGYSPGLGQRESGRHDRDNHRPCFRRPQHILRSQGQSRNICEDASR